MTKKNAPKPAVKKAAGPTPPPGKSRSARARRYDWGTMFEYVAGESMREPVLVVWDELYVHALEKALVGRDNRPLLKLLDAGRALHPTLGAALADVIRSQHDGAPDGPKKRNFAEIIAAKAAASSSLKMCRRTRSRESLRRCLRKPPQRSIGFTTRTRR